MNKLFLFIGIGSLLLVIVLISTCPREAAFNALLEKKYHIVCDEQSFTCVENGENQLELISTRTRAGVFFMTIEKTFALQTGKTKVVKALGVFGKFWGTSLSSQ